MIFLKKFKQYIIPQSNLDPTYYVYNNIDDIEICHIKVELSINQLIYGYFVDWFVDTLYRLLIFNSVAIISLEQRCKSKINTYIIKNRNSLKILSVDKSNKRNPYIYDNIMEYEEMLSQLNEYRVSIYNYTKYSGSTRIEHRKSFITNINWLVD